MVRVSTFSNISQWPLIEDLTAISIVETELLVGFILDIL